MKEQAVSIAQSEELTRLSYPLLPSVVRAGGVCWNKRFMLMGMLSKGHSENSISYKYSFTHSLAVISLFQSDISASFIIPEELL